MPPRTNQRTVATSTRSSRSRVAAAKASDTEAVTLRKGKRKETNSPVTAAAGSRSRRTAAYVAAASTPAKSDTPTHAGTCSDATFITSSPRPSISVQHDAPKHRHHSLRPSHTKRVSDTAQSTTLTQETDENDPTRVALCNISYPALSASPATTNEHLTADTALGSPSASAMASGMLITSPPHMPLSEVDDLAMDEDLDACFSLRGVQAHVEAATDGAGTEVKRRSIRDILLLPFSPGFTFFRSTAQSAQSATNSVVAQHKPPEDAEMEDVYAPVSAALVNSAIAPAAERLYSDALVSLDIHGNIEDAAGQTLQDSDDMDRDDIDEVDGDDYTQDEFELEEFDPFMFMATIPAVPLEYMRRPNALPRKTRSSPPITLVLDLDETLVHCSTSPFGIEASDLRFPVEFNGQTYQVHGRCRPHYRAFLERVSQLFEVVIFTASQQSYADRLLDIIDPKRKLIKYRLFRDSCVHINGNYLKDLSILGRDLSQVVIVDNAPQAFAYQLENGIPIESWYESPHDTELLRVLHFLESLVGLPDVRPSVAMQFGIVDRIGAIKSRLGV